MKDQFFYTDLSMLNIIYGLYNFKLIQTISEGKLYIRTRIHDTTH